MKLSVSIATTLLLLSQSTTVNAFSPRQMEVRTSTTSQLNLFGGGGGGGGGEKKGPGMMDQLAMFKKAQEMAQKKKEIDEELKKMAFEGSDPDGKVKGTFKYVPVANPMDPNPDYEAVSFEFDDEFFDSASSEDLSTAIKAAIESGIESTNRALGEKYAVLQQELMDVFKEGN